jgi:dCTP deaminase
MLSDIELKQYIKDRLLIIEPLTDKTIQVNGVDLRIGNEIMYLETTSTAPYLNTKNLDNIRYFTRKVKVDKRGFIIPRNYNILIKVLEYIKLPWDLMGLCELRSSFARLGLSIPPTIIDAGYSGNLTILLKGSSFPIKLYPKTRFLHIVFDKLGTPVENPYKGTFQGETSIKLPETIES